jgi:hypothetical protein
MTQNPKKIPVILNYTWQEAIFYIPGSPLQPLKLNLVMTQNPKISPKKFYTMKA